MPIEHGLDVRTAEPEQNGTPSRRHETLAQLSRHAIVSADLNWFFEESVRLTAASLDLEFGSLVQLLPTGDTMPLAGVGWPPETTRGARFAMAAHVAYAMREDRLITLDEFHSDPGFQSDPVLAHHGIVSGATVVVRHRASVFGALGVYSRRPRQFSEKDLSFLDAVANIVGLAVERHRSMEALARSEALHRSLVESMPVLVAVFRTDATPEYVSQPMLDFMGLTLEQTRAASWPFQVIHAEDIERHRQAWRHARTAGDEFTNELRLRRGDGTYRWCLYRMVPIRNERREIERWLGAGVDIHDRKLAEEAHRASEERLRRAQHAGKVGTFDWDLATGVLIWDGVEEIHGREAGSFEGTFDAYQRDIHPDDRERVMNAINAAVADAASLDVEYRIICPDDSIRWVNGKARVFTDEQGAALRVTGTCQDVSERKRSAEERERLLAELSVAGAAKDDFLGMVSHELRTPITTIRGNAEILFKRHRLLDDASRLVAAEDIVNESQRLQSLIENLLVLSRVGAGRTVDTEPIMVGRVVDDVVCEHRRNYPGRAYVVTSDAPAATAAADPGYSQQILMNLLINAEKYSPETAPIDVEISSTREHVRISVLDRGDGIAGDDWDRIFEAFYRSPSTAGRAGGTGIGLSVCKRLAEAQGGTIWAEPRPGGGSAFTFTLPHAEISPEP